MCEHVFKNSIFVEIDFLPMAEKSPFKPVKGFIHK